jgi:N-acetylglucosamine-6-phosphate deacetylase
MHLVPGFIDLQVNGGFSFDFTTDPQSIWRVGENLPQYGVTSFLPTIITSPPERTKTAQQVVMAGAPGNYQGAAVLGLHIEGPFLNSEKKGAHNPDYLLPPNIDLYKNFSPSTGIRLVTLAPELPGATAVIKQLVAQEVLVSAGHSSATFEQAIAGFDHGIRYATHTFNAMSPYHQHEPGLVGAALDDNRVTLGLIADGVHVHPAVVRMILRATGINRLNLVTDSVGALGCPPGEYALGDFPVVVDADSVRLFDGTLAGSILSADQAIRNLMTFTGCTLAQAVQTSSMNPARLLQLDTSLGKIEAGFKADLVLLTEQYKVAMTMINGAVVYVNDEIIHIPE